jgi:hypothetical protein
MCFGPVRSSPVFHMSLLQTLTRAVRRSGALRKVLSMALADLLLGADPNRERWVTTGASMIAVDTLVHNWLHRTGILRRLGAEHAYGPACYSCSGGGNAQTTPLQ